MNENIAGKVVVITGASSGLGEATARLLARQGATVALAARRADRIDALATEINEAGGNGKAMAVATDVAKREQVKALLHAVVEKFGKVDVMLNNAGLMPLAPLEDLKTDEWDQMIDVNLKGVLNGIAAALPYMKEQKSGHFINVSSVYGHKLGPDATVYCATKFAVRALSEGLRQEVKPYNIRTTVISPGAVATELLEHISDETIQLQTKEFVGQIAVPAETFARMVAFAINEPANVDVNEILFRPTAQPI
jgi:NADP-dependent 3-hydroxy acid dehydrogenase YdfG